VIIVGTDSTVVEKALCTGALSCPDCSGRLQPWGYGTEREVRFLNRSERRRPRRSICRPCKRTHILLPEDTLARRRYSLEVIGTALTAKALGSDHRKIAADLGAWFPCSTVRDWLRRFSLGAVAIYEHFTRWAYSLDPSHDRLSPGGSDFSDAIEAIGVLGVVAVRRLGPRSPWSLACVVTGGGLLCNTSSLWIQPV
jgi:hypothetical protein